MLSLNLLFTRCARSKSLKTGLASMLASGLSLPAFANLPTMQAPSRGTGSNWLEAIKNYGYDGAMLLGIALCAFFLFIVIRHAAGTFHEIHAGKKTYADLGATVGVGVVLVMASVFFITEATKIF